MKDVSINRCQSFLIKYYPSTCAFSEKGFHLQRCLATMRDYRQKRLFWSTLDWSVKSFWLYFTWFVVSLRFLYSYLNSRKQRVKTNDKYSSFEEILFAVPQGSIFGPLLFNIFIFLILNNIEIACYADENTPYCSYKSFGDVITCLERTADDFLRGLSFYVVK